MANARKRQRLEELDFATYLKKIDSGEELGTYEDTDLINVKFADDKFTLKYRERDSFVFNALLFDGSQTGYAKCSLPRCQERMKQEQGAVVFQCQEYNRPGLQRKFLERHLRVYHKTEEELETQKRKSNKERKQSAKKRDQSQPSIMDFVQPPPATKQINYADLEKLKALNASVIASCNLSLDFFVSEEMMERDQFLLKLAGIDPMQAHKFNRGETAVKEDLFKIGSANRQLIKSVAPKLAEMSRVSMQIDHQAVLQLTAETGRDAYGTALILAASNKKRYSYLLGFQNVESTRIADTVKFTQQIAQV